MNELASFDPAGLVALVIDRNHFQRNITLEQLRMMGFGRVISAGDIASAWQAVVDCAPHVILIEWLDDAEGGLDFVRRVRSSEQSPNHAAQIFMLTSRGSKADVESARLAGIDGYLRKPISAFAIEKRVRRAVTQPKPFIVTASYIGPCRRGPPEASYAGPWRRLSDVLPASPIDESDLDVSDAVRGEIARARTALLNAAAAKFTSGDLNAARQVFQATTALLTLADEIKDPILGLGCREMLRYMQAHGATAGLDPDVVRTHAGALHHLAHLPMSFREQRTRVAYSLKRMVDKKIKQIAGQ